MTTFPLPRLLLPIDPPGVFTDERGTFVESWRTVSVGAHGIPPMVCGLTSHSAQRALRGLHYQRNRPRALVIRVGNGLILDLTVDLRKNSPTFGRVDHLVLGNASPALYIPPGFAHGFLALAESVVLYDCSEIYDQASSETLLWNDPAIVHMWPPNFLPPIVSAKDQAGKRLDEIEPIEV